MSYRYAQIDNDGRVICDSYLSGEVIADYMIPITEEFDLTNKKYVNGEWVEYIPENIESEEITAGVTNDLVITEQDKIQAEILLNQCNLLINQENQDKVLAEILLNQMGV